MHTFRPGHRRSLAGFASTGFFEAPQVESYCWTLVLDPAQVGALYATYSSISRLPAEERQSILAQLMEVAERQFGGRVTRNMISPIYVAKRKTHRGQ